MGLIADIHKDLENGALQLIVEYSERLHALAVKMCGDEAQAEDLVFRTFERVLTKAKTYKSDTNLFGWMKSIMENIHKDDLKRPVARNTTTVEAEELEQYAGADWSTDEQLLKNSDSEALREALHRLDPKYNQVLLMRYYQEFSMKQIANILQLPLGTVTRRVQIAHQILAGKLRAEFGKVKKPLAVLLAALLGVGSLFGAWQAGLLDPLLSQITDTARSGEAESFPLQEEAEASLTQEESQSETTKEQTMNLKTVKTLAASAVVAASAAVSNAGYVPTWRGLPEGYTQVTYIESSGSQYVDLGIPAKSGLAMGTVMSWVQVQSEVGYCSAVVGSRIEHLYYSSCWMLGYSGSWLNTNGKATADKIYRVDSELRNGRQVIHIEDENGNAELDWAKSPVLTGDVNLNVNLALFGRVVGSTSVSNKCKARCYELMFWSVDGEGARTLVGDFVPCLDENGAAGLYDLVGEAFHAPSAALAYGAPVLQLDTLTVEAEAEQGDVTPAFGKVTDLEDGQSVPFSAPPGEFRLADGSYCSYNGYRLYVTRDGAETLADESSTLSGTYVHAAGTSARLEWLQTVRKGGRMFPTAWSSVVSVPGYDVAETLVNFPVLFRLAEDSPEGFSYAACRADGNDILFTDAGGNVIPHEIEKWDPEGESLIWVNLPKLAKGTTFRFCYGNASVEEPAPAANVWSDGFAGVWHLDETGTAATAIDATGRGNDGVAATWSTGGLDEMTAEGDGAICGARRIGTTKNNYYQTPSSTAFDLGSTFTVSAWIRGTGTAQSRLFGHKSGWNTASGWEILWTSGTMIAPRGSGGDTERARSLGNSATTWTHAVWVFNGASVSTYSNGVKSGDDSVITPVVDASRALAFGSASSQGSYNGSLDEVRIMGGAANALRIKADYDTVTSAEFLSAAPARQSAGADVLTVVSSGREIGTVTPDWGEHTGLADGQVIPFSAPAEEQVESEDVHFSFTGYSLYSTGTDGTERLIETRDATSGTYTHVGGTTARLVWRGNDLFRVSAETNHGTVVGCGYVRLGGQVTLRAVADEGYRFSEWVGDAVPDELRESPEITLTVSGVTPLVARFTVKPSLAAFWDFKEGAAGSPVTATANAKGPESFSGSGAVVENASGAGLLPVYSAETPGFKVYSDATCAELLADRPQSVRFGANDLAHGGGEVTIAGLGSWISRQDVCTVEFFCRGDVYRASRAAFSLDVGNDPNALYYPAGSAAAILFSCETDRAGHKGGVSPAGEYGFSPSYDAWHHVAVVYSRERQVAKVYLDRVYKTAEKSVAIVEQEDGGVPLRLGSAMANNAAANCFSGYIACLRVSAGELVPADFMCAAPYEPEGDTLAFYSLRGRKGDAVKTVSPVLGCSRLTGEARLVDGKDAPIVYSDDVPGAALYDGEAGLASGVPLARRISSVDIRNVEDGDSADDAASVLDFYDMSTELSSRDAFTIEFFAKFDGAGTWRAVTAYNISGGTMGKTGVYVDMPYGSASQIGIVGGASVSVPSLHENRVWHHLAFTYDKTSRQMKFYVDYSKSPASFGLKTAPTVASLVFGGDTGKSRAFRGKIAGVRISTRALTPSEFLIAAPRPDSGFILMLK